METETFYPDRSASFWFSANYTLDLPVTGYAHVWNSLPQTQ